MRPLKTSVATHWLRFNIAFTIAVAIGYLYVIWNQGI